MTFILGLIGFFFIVGVIAAACQAIGGLYWELKEGLHRTPRIGAQWGPQVREPVTRRGLISAGVWVGIGTLLVLLMAGCVSAGKVSPTIWHRLTLEQQTEAAVLERAMIRLCDFAWTQGSLSCRPPAVLIVADGIPHYKADHNMIVLPRGALHPGARAVVSHELFHWYAEHNAQRCSANPVACELDANWGGFQILREGYGYDGDTAWRIMRRYLQMQVESKRKPSPGHPPACVELEDFLRRSEMSPGPCSEQAAEASK
jgi:hypothetical protein